MELTDNQILSQTQVLQKIKRIAFEIYENNFEESEIIIAGIKGQGYSFAKLLAEMIGNISSIKAIAVLIDMDKEVPNPSITFDCEDSLLEQKAIIVVDDVLNTGRTFAYGLSPFLRLHVKRLQTAVIVDRGYHRFPIAANYIGYELSTTINEHVKVILDNPDEVGVYLS
jgi:pyrimidine operon attenuation protein/uracil phosphoribosyltransferase